MSNNLKYLPPFYPPFENDFYEYQDIQLYNLLLYIEKISIKTHKRVFLKFVKLVALRTKEGSTLQ